MTTDGTEESRPQAPPGQPEPARESDETRPRKARSLRLISRFRFAQPHDSGAAIGRHPATGRPMPKGTVTRAAYDSDGQLVQWTCMPGDHGCLTRRSGPKPPPQQRRTPPPCSTASTRNCSCSCFASPATCKTLVDLGRAGSRREGRGQERALPVLQLHLVVLRASLSTRST
jgi:hypothetical protein